MGKPVYSIGRLVKAGVLNIHRGSHAGSTDNGGCGSLQIELAQITIHTDTIHLATIVGKEGYIALVKRTYCCRGTLVQIQHTQFKAIGRGGVTSIGLAILGVEGKRGRDVRSWVDAIDGYPSIDIIFLQLGGSYHRTHLEY